MRKKKKKNRDRKRERCMNKREREKRCVGKRQKTGKKTKKVHTLENIIQTASQHPCVYNNNNIIISSVASKQQSDTSTKQAEAWSLLELCKTSIHIFKVLSGSLLGLLTLLS